MYGRGKVMNSIVQMNHCLPGELLYYLGFMAGGITGQICESAINKDIVFVII